MTPDWTLSARDIVPGATPRPQTCPRCKLVYRRVRLAKATPDGCPMCALVKDAVQRREHEARVNGGVK